MEDPILISKSAVYNTVSENKNEQANLKCIEHQTPLSTPFTSTDSLRKETERKKTFIDWPLNFIQPDELVKHGFYYLRTLDHVACAFCRGIVGAWEEGDDPSSEHIKHFPHCPFVQGRYCGNVTASESNNSSCESEERMQIREMNRVGTDYCTRRIEDCGNSKVQGQAINFDELGLPQYSGPRHREFITYVNRINSFTKWPERVKQTPQELAEAGFFSNGLSDHVICFHCGNGIRNWQNDAVPWVEHALHYPECSFVMFKTDKTVTKEVSVTEPEEEICKKLKKDENIIQGNTVYSTECKKIEDSRLCKICLDSELEVVFLPCAHMSTCASCALTQTHCPICRTQINHIIKPIMA